jgi:hypothetical protein
MKTLPRNIYVVVEAPSNAEPFLLAGETMLDLGIDIGGKKKIGLYKLVGTYDAEGCISTNKLRPVKSKR